MKGSMVDVVSRRGFLRAAAGAAFASPLLLGSTSVLADEWEAPAEMPGAPADAPICCIDVSGRWPCGSWRSFCTGHHGKLHGVLHRDACGDYRCRFGGTFAKIVPFIYPVTLHVVGCGEGIVYFRGSKSLLGLGTFCYEGHATCNCFQFHYTTRKDRGIFQMSR